MYTKKDLTAHLKQIGVHSNGTLMVHLSCKSVGEVDGRGETVLDALCEYMADGLLVLPTHTWANVNDKNPVMDVTYTPVCVGAVPELFRKRSGVYRSLHPTHSVGAFGKDAAAFVQGEHTVTTPCGKGGVYHKLWERNAQILLIGVNFTNNTFIHGIEEWDGGVGSISQTKTDLYVVNHEGRRLHTPQYRHCAPLGSNTFSKLEPDCIAQGHLTIGRFGDATTRLIRTVPLRALTAEYLKRDPTYLLKH